MSISHTPGCSRCCRSRRSSSCSRPAAGCREWSPPGSASRRWAPCSRLAARYSVAIDGRCASLLGVGRRGCSVGDVADRARRAGRSADRADARRRVARQPARADLLDRLHARRRALPLVLRRDLAVHRRHARRGARRTAGCSCTCAGRSWGSSSYLLIGFWFEEPMRRQGRDEGVPRHAHRRRGLRAGARRDVDSTRSRSSSRRSSTSSRPAAGSARRSSPPRCCCSSARWARARSSRCTCGSPTRWPARRPARRSSTPRRWSPPASTSWRARSRCSRRTRRRCRSSASSARSPRCSAR